MSCLFSCGISWFCSWVHSIVKAYFLSVQNILVLFLAVNIKSWLFQYSNRNKIMNGSKCNLLLVKWKHWPQHTELVLAKGRTNLYLHCSQYLAKKIISELVFPYKLQTFDAKLKWKKKWINFKKFSLIIKKNAKKKFS